MLRVGVLRGKGADHEIVEALEAVSREALAVIQVRH